MLPCAHGLGHGIPQRALDIVLVAITLPLWVPVVFLMAALKMLTDGRPVLFRHVRLGRDSRPFVLHKIRTTPHDFQPGPHDWSDEEFPPRTRFGRWLRRFDLDELPQLWNVLKGEMSLVGPRPEMPAHAEAFSCRLPQYGRRLGVRPGLTGLAQYADGAATPAFTSGSLRSGIHRPARPGLYFTILARTVSMEVRRLFGNPSINFSHAETRKTPRKSGKLVSGSIIGRAPCLPESTAVTQ
jgi:lipopolysaccharide/colanic/teichoic acid biosynthesis glycosyltransferase